MKYHRIKYVRRTPVELKSFREAVKEMTKEGYPVDVAEQRAWDVLFSVRNAKRNKELR
jgi:hypothetical protein